MLHRSTLAGVTEVAVRVLQRYQVDAEALLVRAGLGPAPYRQPEARLDMSKLIVFWREATAATGDPCLGFEVGKAIVPSNLHALGFAWLASRTVLEGLQRLARYHRMLTTAVDIDVRTEDHRVTLDLTPHHMAQEGIDALLCAVVVMCRAMSDDEFHPAQVLMTRARPPCDAALERFFRCPITYGDALNELAFDRQLVTQELPRQSAVLAQVNDAVAREYVQKLDRNDVVTQVRASIIDMLCDGEPCRDQVAERLNLSVRTLQRRLSKEGTSFKVLLDDTRHELAMGYVARPDLSMGEITYLLGFSDQSNFARAFKRWTARSPLAYRQSLVVS